jgi:hypothetical protein
VFYYCQETDQSLYEDPKIPVFNDYYLQLKLVAKMKEKLPYLAKARKSFWNQGTCDETKYNAQAAIKFHENDRVMIFPPSSPNDVEDCSILFKAANPKEQSSTIIQSHWRGSQVREQIKPIMQEWTSSTRSSKNKSEQPLKN